MNTIPKTIKEQLEQIAKGQHIAGYIISQTDNSISFSGLTSVEADRYINCVKMAVKNKTTYIYDNAKLSVTVKQEVSK